MTEAKEKHGAPAARRPTGTPEPMTRTVPVLTSDTLFGAARELIIRHGKEHYRLCQTKSGKLLLIK